MQDFDPSSTQNTLIVKTLSFIDVRSNQDFLQSLSWTSRLAETPCQKAHIARVGSVFCLSKSVLARFEPNSATHDTSKHCVKSTETSSNSLITNTILAVNVDVVYDQSYDIISGSTSITNDDINKAPTQLTMFNDDFDLLTGRITNPCELHVGPFDDVAIISSLSTSVDLIIDPANRDVCLATSAPPSEAF